MPPLDLAHRSVVVIAYPHIGPVEGDAQQIGVSGATVWAVEPEGNDEVACVLRPTAIQVAFRHGFHLRGEPLVGATDLLARRH